MINPKEEYKQKFQKDKLHKNISLRKAGKCAAQDYRLEKIKSSLLVQDYPEEERQKIEKDLQKLQKQVLYDHYKDIANRIKYKDNYSINKPENIMDYDFPLI
ncbi:unnamed protein product [Paramecium primaurelia]|uniref:Uncharacterized protein n=1 Tax=Paramecium primaurelia TaxID=5886 RepID=A0A8S1NJT6_PARPR|nr:unnamed protein product [Paramecium primaurelia]